MSGALIDGKAAAAALRADVAEAALTLPRKPGLAVVLVGDDAASQVYVGSKEKAAGKANINGQVHRMPGSSTQAEVLAQVKALAEDDAVDGILVQLPLPGHLDADEVIATIPPEKDVDGLTEASAGALVLGREGLTPCTPQGSMRLIRQVMPDLSGKHAVVVGRSILVGKPLALMLLAANATVTMAHSRTKDLGAVCREADILCVAVGRPEMVTADMVKPGAIVIDVGINRVAEKKLVGDVAFEGAKEVAGHITPVPGGVGPMTIACLLANTVAASARRQGVPVPEKLR
ncbi:bifunctional methylenetetrahydrofolate dehydrogenase/methenyltetrahydrofolate cyclohydrolase FolD [Parvularcula sp. ZS-1/3]|uniref:Bifunctional protein FolD n=1 Tax=Parvularcula mediterranea TaxID=2732508 RepID=A0A7Y3RLV8_9PROT|nr:bifunctional methylenetetrahydrofolate dehydrogenase/methenyltetrahydrofolate cyclohydrolase FolD [Parvularcula mediterranea]NNU16469.1 bifunctional methylenetetrahydrofolate dehydrogenase/methenyltetrahydrofolate cyclohydrolase FolD [Parvularcula mediterranea]